MGKWIKCNLPWVNYNVDGRDFQKLAKPGVLIEFENGETLLIGHINKLGGVCDCCVEFSDSAIIKRYKVLVEFEEG